MPALQVRDCPDSLCESMRACAREDHRSLSQQVVVALQDYLERRNARNAHADAVCAAGGSGSMSGGARRWETDSEAECHARVEKRRALFAEIDALPRFEIPEGFPSSTEIIRESRDSR